MGFWIAAAGLTLLVAVPLLMVLRRNDARATAPAHAQDIQVYRDQLQEIDRDLARGVIDAADADRLRTEVSRRLIEADRAAKREDATPAAGTPALLVPVVLVALVMAGSFALYARIGAPGYPDLALADRISAAEKIHQTRPSQSAAEAEAPTAEAAADAKYIDLVQKLRAAVADRPDDLQGQTLLAQSEAALGNFAAAHAAQSRVIALKGDAANALDHAALADLMILAAGGYVSPEAEAALTETLRRDPRNGTARYYSGLMYAQTGRPDLAFRIWRDLAETSPPEAPWMEPIRAGIEELADLAGEKYRLPQAAPLAGPSAEDVANAAEMSDEDRTAMIRGMVERLSDRLATEGGSADEWSRLIAAYGTLGETDRAAEIWQEAQSRFADRADDLAQIRAAALKAGVAK